MLLEITFKDFLPLIGTLATITAGYYFLSAQARKNRQLKWLDDFINEVANVSSLATSMSVGQKKDIEKNLELMKSVNVLRLYIYPFRNPPMPHRNFIARLLELQEIIMSEINSSQTFEEAAADAIKFGRKLAEVMTLATKVIRLEQEKI